MVKTSLIKKGQTDQKVLAKLSSFKFFEKEQYLRDLSQIVVLLSLGLGLFFLLKIPFWGFRPILITGKTFFFRYSFFGNIVFVVALFRLAKITSHRFWNSYFMGGILLFSLQGFSSFFDPTGTFITNPFLELMTAIYPFGLLLSFDRVFSRTLRFSWHFLFVASYSSYFLILYFMYGAGVLFVTSSTRLGKVLMFFKISELATLLRGLHFLLGLIYIVVLMLVLYRKKKLIPNFEKMERLAYLG